MIENSTIIQRKRSLLSPSCPISHSYLDSHVVRLIALQVLVLGVLLLTFNMLLFGWLLLWDFLMRALRMHTFSPLRYIATTIVRTAKLPPKPCDEAPKRFATYLGLTFMVFIMLLLLLSFTFSARVLITGLMICAALEAFFDYCVGCKIYHYTLYLKRYL